MRLGRLPAATHHTAAWVAVVTLFNAAVVWGYVLFVAPGPGDYAVTASATGHGDGGHGAAATKDDGHGAAPKKDDGHGGAASGDGKAKKPDAKKKPEAKKKPAKKDAKKDDGHGGGH